MNSSPIKCGRYRLVPPEGGYGYIIATAVTVMMTVTVTPMGSFGLIFGNFLRKIGDETTGTTLANGFFVACLHITGFVANGLLRKYSYRTVALMGAVVFCIGSFTTIFVNSIHQFVTSFGLIQGFGVGLMYPAFFTGLNFYFDKRLSIVNNVVQIFLVVGGMSFPLITDFFMTTFGFRGTVALLSALGFNTILATIALQPVKFHLKKEEITEQEEDLIDDKPKVNSVVALATENDETLWTTLVKSLDLHTFKDPLYLNITIGLSLGFTADLAFISIMPLIYTNAGYTTETATFFMFVYYLTDLIGRITLTLIVAFVRIRNKNRYLFLGGSVIIVIFRTVFLLRNDYYWKLITTICLGFLRYFIQSTFVLVIAEQYSENFSTAFSLYMVVCGVVSLLLGPLMSYVKACTQSDAMVVHLLSLAYLIMVISWTLELILRKIRRVNQKRRFTVQVNASINSCE